MSRARRVLVGVATVVLTVALAVQTATLFKDVHRAVSPDLPPTLPVCQTEDDPGDCYWDANRRGNQEGSSFIHYHNNYYLLDN